MNWFTVRDTRAGFALPTLLIASVVMLIIMVSAVSAVSTTRVALNNQYYAQIAREAAEAGATRAAACLKESNYAIGWSDAKPLMPNTDCNGNVQFACPVGSTNTQCYVLYGGAMTSTFSVDGATSDGGVIKSSATGTLSLARSVNAASVYKTYSEALRTNANLGFKEAQYVSSGYLQVCAIFDGTTWCWGDNSFGSLGIGTITSDKVLVPVKALRLPGGLQGETDKIVSVGSLTVCIATVSNNIYCMGKNSRGQVGDNSTTTRTTATKVVMPPEMIGKNISDIEMGDAHACALADGDVFCWGYGTYGEIGVNNYTTYKTPQRVQVIGTANGRTVTAISTSTWSDTNCAIAVGKVYCWGRNDRAQLGNGNTTNSPIPIAVTATGSSSLIGKTLTKVAVAGGFGDQPNNGDPRRGHVCVLDTTGSMHCWGSDQFGETGQGVAAPSPYNRPIPVKVNLSPLSSSVITDIAVSFSTSCALVGATNNIYCWGANYGGQIGDGTYSYRLNAAQVAQLNPGLLGKTVSSITGGANRNCAIADSVSYCWGTNSSAGQIGDGTLINRTTPTEATMLRQYQPLIYF